jgi:hypothetical protein
MRTSAFASCSEHTSFCLVSYPEDSTQ